MTIFSLANNLKQNKQSPVESWSSSVNQSNRRSLPELDPKELLKLGHYHHKKNGRGSMH